MSTVVEPVSVHGFTWTAGLVAVLNVLVGGAIVALIKTRPRLKEIAAEREANLLSERAEAMKEMAKRLDVMEAELRATNHKLNNVTQAFEWLVDTIEFNPERAQEAAKKARAMRTAQMQGEAQEKGAVMAAKITKE